MEASGHEVVTIFYPSFHFLYLPSNIKAFSIVSAKLDNKYPAGRSSTETERLHKQHKLVKSAFGDLILCPVELSKPAYEY